VDCNTTSIVTTTSLCYFEGPTIAYPRGRIVWQGVLGPDLGVTDPDVAVNEISITFDISVAAGISSVQNNATLDSDLNGNGTTTDPGEQNVATASAFWTRTSSMPSNLPSTGFAPNQLTRLPSQTILYSDLGDLWLEIPRLGVKIPIVGIPLTNGKWDVSWLGDQAGWLNGTAFPTWAGNSVVTGHVFDAYGQPGPFVHLNWLWYGDKVIVHAWGGEFVYEVRQVTQVTPDAISSVIKHEDLAWLTLVTCRGYDQASNSYKYRVAVRAVLIEVK
jgi:LPXTG-site transpeptidase (sortase) family protein